MKTKFMILFCLIFIPSLLAISGASLVSAGNNPPGGKAFAKGDTNGDHFMADSKEIRFEVAKGFNSHSQTKSTTLATAIDAYIYGYPLVLEEFTRQVMLASEQLKAMNQFTSICYLLEPDDQDVRRPNNDTLYSQAFLDLSTEPLILQVPDTTGYYYVLQIMDAWTNTFSAPGTRTTGSSAQEFAIVGPDWKGHLPRPMKVIKSPTNMVWIIGRTQVKTDYPPEGTCSPPSYTDVWEIMKQYTLTSLSQWPDTEPSPLYCDDDIPSATSHLTPSQLVAQLTGVEFFQMLSDLMRDNPAAYQDKPALKNFEAIDFVPGAPFNPPANMVADINAAPENAILLMKDQWQTLGDSVNAWRVTVSDIGTYGTNYLTRAAVALYAPGANIPEDGFYPNTYDALETIDGQIQAVQLNGSKKYIIHLDPVPPVKAFWSITVYDKDGFLVANPICRYAIHSTDQAIEGQTSVEILLQADEPDDPDKIGFWLPIPGPSPDQNNPELADFNLTLRMYWPDKTALKGKWVPPPVLIQQ